MLVVAAVIQYGTRVIDGGWSADIDGIDWVNFETLFFRAGIDRLCSDIGHNVCDHGLVDSLVGAAG